MVTYIEKAAQFLITHIIPSSSKIADNHAVISLFVLGGTALRLARDLYDELDTVLT